MVRADADSAAKVLRLVPETKVNAAQQTLALSKIRGKSRFGIQSEAEVAQMG
jgi:hypothetical protein